MILRRDHIAGGAFVVAGVLILAVSHDLPFGTLASPGAGMLPMLINGLMILFGVILFLGASRSPRMAEIDWNDMPHALKAIGVTSVAAALYTSLGFILTMALLLFVLLYVIERRGLSAALAFSIPIPIVIYFLFDHLLKAPLERGLLWF